MAESKETKIVKAVPKQNQDKADDQPRVTVKAAVIPQQKKTQPAARPQAAQQSSTSAAPGRRVPIGKPVVNKELEARTPGSAVNRIPAGAKVVAKEESDKIKQQEMAANKPEEVKVEAPMTEEPKVETPKAEEKKETKN